MKNPRVGICMLLVSGMTAVGESKYDLSLHLHQGQSWSFDQVFESIQTYRMSAPGQQPFSNEQRMRSIRKGTITVLAVTNGVPTAVRVAFDPGCVTKMKQMGNEQTLDFPFAGVAVTLQRTVDGQITQEYEGEVKGGGDAVSRKELEAYLYSNDGRPKHPVALGEQWEPELNQLKQIYQLSDQDKAVGASKVAEITTISGRQAAEVIVYTSVSKHQGEMVMTEERKGSIWLDLETGYLLQSSLEGTTSGKGSQSMPGPNGQTVNVDVNNSGRSQARLTTQLGNPGAVGGGNETAFTKPIISSPPALADGMAPGTERWAGSYHDTQLTLELKVKGAADYEGALVFRGHTYPLKARAEGSRMNGTFQSEDGSFEFTATAEGATVKFVTGGKTYQLKKRAINPLGLDAPMANPGSAPANPLGDIHDLQR
jgi:hypothetical protein